MQESSGEGHTSKSFADAPPLPPQLPAHTLWALSMIGVYEAAGDADNPQIREFHAATKGGEAPDSVPWCSSFQNWCFLKRGVVGTRTKRARDWVERVPPGFRAFHTHGSLAGVEVGDVVVLRRGDNPSQGHVTQFLGFAAHKGFMGLGGNQGNEVSVERYLVSRVVGFVRYVGG